MKYKPCTNGGLCWMASIPKPIGVCVCFLHNDHKSRNMPASLSSLTLQSKHFLSYIRDCPTCMRHVWIYGIDTQQLLKTTTSHSLPHNPTINSHTFLTLFHHSWISICIDVVVQSSSPPLSWDFTVGKESTCSLAEAFSNDCDKTLLWIERKKWTS